MVIVQCEACNRTIYSDEEFYSLNKSKCPADVVLEIYPPERKHFCNECINKALDYLVPDIQKEIMARFDNLIKDIKDKSHLEEIEKMRQAEQDFLKGTEWNWRKKEG